MKSAEKNSNRVLDPTIIKLLVVIAAVLIIMGINIPATFFSATNFRSMFFQIPEFGLFAMAMMIAMLTGGVDLSIVGNANLTSILIGTFLHVFYRDSMSSSMSTLLIFIAFLFAILIGTIAGLINGVMISALNVPPILTTLGTSSLYGGLGIVITKGSAIYDFPEQVKFLGNGYVFGFLPAPALIFFILFAIMVVIIQGTEFGVRLYMLGTNRKAYVFSGLNSARMYIESYVLSGILAAIAGFIILSRTNTANADYGNTYIMQSILVCVLGGINPNGGKGKVSHLLFSIITIQLLSSGMNMMNINSYFKQFVNGTLLLIMIISNNWAQFTGFKKIKVSKRRTLV